MGLPKVAQFPKGFSGKKGVCGRKVASPYGKAVMIPVPNDLVPYVRLVVLAVSFMQSIGVSILPGIMTIVAQQIARYSLKPGHKMKDIGPLVGEMVETFQRWDGTKVELSDMESMLSLLALVVDAARNQEPLAKEELNAIAISAKDVKGSNQKSSKRSSPSKTSRQKSLAAHKGFGRKPKNSEPN